MSKKRVRGGGGDEEEDLTEEQKVKHFKDLGFRLYTDVVPLEIQENARTWMHSIVLPSTQGRSRRQHQDPCEWKSTTFYTMQSKGFREKVDHPDKILCGGQETWTGNPADRGKNLIEKYSQYWHEKADDDSQAVEGLKGVYDLVLGLLAEEKSLHDAAVLDREYLYLLQLIYYDGVRPGQGQRGAHEDIIPNAGHIIAGYTGIEERYLELHDFHAHVKHRYTLLPGSIYIMKDQCRYGFLFGGHKLTHDPTIEPNKHSDAFVFRFGQSVVCLFGCLVVFG